MLRLGIAGVGAIAESYISLIAAGQADGVELAALCSRNRAHIGDVMERYQLHCAAFQDYSELLQSGLIDGVLICTPHGQHPVMALQAVEAGLHVLLEKPVGILEDEVQRVQRALAERPELVCGVLYNRRASQAFRCVKQLAASGEVGELIRCTWLITDLYRTNAYYGTSPWRGTWQGEGGGLLMTQASHQLDLMQWICGMPASVLARCSTVGRPIQVENEAELFLTYPNGAHGHFIASAHECPGTNLLEICGTKGKITVRNDSEVEITRLQRDEREFAQTCADPFQKAPSRAETLTFLDSDNRIQHAATIRNFAQSVEGRETIQCSLEDGLRSLQIIHGAYLSHWKKAEIRLPAAEQEFRRFLQAQNQA